MKIIRTYRNGFTLVEIMIVVAIVGLLAGIGMPNFLRARNSSQTNACINNLRTIDGAKQQWALELGKTGTDTPVAAEIQPYIGRGETGSLGKTYCPLVAPGALAGYDVNEVGIHPTCKQEDPVTHPAVLN
jgi:prepilin-type N-terminal cleavage/methylation domain-containing protein